MKKYFIYNRPSYQIIFIQINFSNDSSTKMCFLFSSFCFVWELRYCFTFKMQAMRRPNCMRVMGPLGLVHANFQQELSPDYGNSKEGEQQQGGGKVDSP